MTHVAFGAIIAMVIVAAFHGTHKSLILSIILYFTLCFGLWIIGDWIFGANELPSTHEFQRF